jgi:curved DNA-binding protein CbpA
MRGIEELDHYELLEIGRNATASEIDRAYRTAQQTYGEGSLALYSVFESFDARAIRDRLDDAYRVLADAELRTQYHAELAIEAPNSAGRETGHPAGQAALFRFDEQSDAGTQTELHADGALDAAPIGDSLDEAVEEYDAIDDDGRGEFDGNRLRRNRLFRGYEIADISDVTKVSSSHLRNIEAENFGDLPADVYVRGFVAAYAQTIGLDPKVVVPSYMARVLEFRGDDRQGRFHARH